MRKGSTAIYKVFLWFFTASAVCTLYYSFCIYLLDITFQYLWVIGYIVISSLILSFFYFIPKISKAFAILSSFTLSMILIYAAKFALLFFLPPKTFYNLDDIGVAVTGSTLFLLILGVFVMVNSKFTALDDILAMEDSITDKEKYISYLKEVFAGNRKHRELERYIGMAANLGILFLMLTLFTLMRSPETKWVYSILLLFYTFGSIGIYLVLYQMKSILDWKILGYEVPKDITKRWNRIFVWFFIPLIVIPLAIPWNYQVVELKFLNSFIAEQTSGIKKIDFSVKPPLSPVNGTNTAAVETNAPLTVDESKTVEPKKGIEAFLPLLYVLGGIVGLYLVLAVIGGILGVTMRYKKRSPFVEFLIRRYKRVRAIVDGILNVLVFIGKLFLTLLGVSKFKSSAPKELSSPVARQLFALFDSDKEMPDEKKEEIKTIIREFVKLIDITNRFLIPYRFYYGPFEYMEKVMNSIPEETEVIERIVEIFNESRYSLHLLEELKKENFMKAVAYLIGRITDTHRAEKDRPADNT
ncbi:MAG: hypothetical protein A2Y33_04165 [Spirochaetes bacterium GWF1_51_8]|nr:MAG: hypothetical protein A2Y33_04165 [Spirochaetes bacterium GWF1_51_8]